MIIVTIVFVLFATATIFLLANIAKHSKFINYKTDYINFQTVYQISLLIFSLCVLLLLYMMDQANFEHFIQIGDISAPAQRVDLLGIPEGENWLSLGMSLTFVITLVTSIVIYLQFKLSKMDIIIVFPYIKWVVFFSLTNSFAEEVIYRAGVIIPLYGKIDNTHIYLLSAILFGIPHYKGLPSGITGVFMAALLGYLLAKSVVETHGFFWAWSIHFLQDVVIIAAALATSLYKTNNNLRTVSE